MYRSKTVRPLSKRHVLIWQVHSITYSRWILIMQGSESWNICLLWGTWERQFSLSSSTDHIYSSIKAWIIYNTGCYNISIWHLPITARDCPTPKRDISAETWSLPNQDVWEGCRNILEKLHCTYGAWITNCKKEQMLQAVLSGLLSSGVMWFHQSYRVF